MRTYNEIVEYLASLIEDASLGAIKASEISPDAGILSDLGLDSLDYASVLLACEKWLGIQVREEGVNWELLSSVANLAAFLEQEQNR